MGRRDYRDGFMPYLSPDGLAMEKELKARSKEYGYKAIPPLVAMMMYENGLHAHYTEKLPDFWKNEKFRDGGFAITAHDGTVLATGVTERGFVCGDYGVFVEIPPEKMVMENVTVQKGEEYRINDPRYSERVKYQWFTDKTGDGIKLYFQQRSVDYADYVPGMWYVSPYEISVQPYERKKTETDLSLKKGNKRNKMEDKLFLLSKEEYEKYQDKIPQVDGWWWLRSKGNSEYTVAVVDNVGQAYPEGNGIHCMDGGVRPAFYLDTNSDILRSGEDTFLMGDYNSKPVKWVILDQDTGLCITEDILCESIFDGASNNYETSDIRNFLKGLEKESFLERGEGYER